MPEKDQPTVVPAHQLSPTPAAAPLITIDPSKLKAQATSLLVLLTFAVSFCTAVAGFAAKRDLAGFILYVQRDDVLTGVAAVVAFGTLIYRQFAARRRVDTTNALAITSPVATLTKPVTVVEGSIVDQAIQASPVDVLDLNPSAQVIQ